VIEPRDLRHMLGWTQTDLGVAMSWSQSKVARFEASEPVMLSDEDRVRLARLRVLADGEGARR
jgi:transcriptional regulator with XRE-family HTH domain